MITAKEANEMFISDIKDALDETSKKIADRVIEKYNRESKHLGKDPELNYDVVLSSSKDMLNMVFLSKGQKALILEYGKGSLMERTPKGNPSIYEYLHGTIFNKDRLKFNLETVSRVKSSKDAKDEYYLDLDEKLHKKGTTVLRSRETGKDIDGNIVDKKPNPLFQPLEPKHLIRETIKEFMNKIIEDVTSQVIAKRVLRDMIDGYVISNKV